MDIPTEQDWRSEPWDLDITYAYKHFSNKSLKEATELFEKDSMTYQEDLVFMPRNCFAFYVHAYIDYLLSEQSRGDSDGASCFFGLVSARKKDFASVGQGLVSKTIHLLEYMRSRQQWYDADINIYGKFSKLADHAQKNLRNTRI